MRKMVFEVGAAVAAAAIVSVVAAISGSLSGPARWVLVVATALVAFGVGWLATRRVPARGQSGTQIGNRIKAKKDVVIQDVAVGPDSGDVSIGNDLRAKRGSARLHRINAPRNPQK